MTLGTDVFLCASKTCRLCELVQQGKEQEGSTVKVLSLVFLGVFFFFLMIVKEIGVDKIC